MSQNSRYDNYFLKKKMAADGVQDLSGAPGEGVAEVDWRGNSNLTQNKNVVPMQEPEQVAGTQKMDSGTSAAMGAGQALASGGNASDVASAGLMASGNPYAMGAGLGLMTINQINKRQQQEKMNQYTAEVERIKARQDAINRLSQIGANLRA